MNYAEMKDHEINLGVLKKYIPYEDLVSGPLDDGSIMWGDGANWHKFNPCNSWADAGPIIGKENISLIFGFGHWDAMSPDGQSLQAEEVNPLRAAMIVFLMMQEKKDEQ